MLTLQALLSLPVFLSSSIVAHALAAPNNFIAMAAEGVTLDEYAIDLTGGEKCNRRQLDAIRAGFHEMNLLFATTLPFNPSSDAEREFFGPEERTSNYTQLIESNLRRAIQYANGPGNGTSMPDIHVRCDDPNDYCRDGNRRDGKHVAYNIGNEPHINFCKRYFNLDGLEERVKNIAENATINQDLMAYYNRGTAWARQLMHISEVGQATVERALPQNANTNFTQSWSLQVSNAPMNTSFLAGVENERPRTESPNDIQSLKYAYGATRAKLLATLSTQAPYDAANNAESYALFAQARFVMEKRNFYPSLPEIDFDDEVALLADNELQEGEKKRYAYFDSMDVVPLTDDTNAVGEPITSAAPSLHRGQIYRIGSEWIAGLLVVLLLAYL